MGRVGSGRVGSGRVGSGRVGSGQVRSGQDRFTWSGKGQRKITIYGMTLKQKTRINKGKRKEGTGRQEAKGQEK
jgi:hypothetical protein